jgi:hypothetical protein
MLPSTPPRSDPIRKRYYDSLELANKVSDVLFYCGAALSLVMPFLDKASHPILYSWGLILFGAVAVALFGLGLVVRLYLTPRAEDERRKDFLTSACGIDLAQETTVGYYNNDLSKPTERIAAQILENAYFTKSGALCLSRVERTKILLYFAAWLVCVLNRDVDLGWIVAASQALFSEQVVSKWIRLEWLRIRTERIFDSVYQLFQARPNVTTFNAMAFESFAKYESTKSNAAITLSTRIFEANNAKWTAEWEAIKVNLKIGSKP